MRLTRLLQHCDHVNITDETQFQWARFLAAHPCGSDILMYSNDEPAVIVKAIALMWSRMDLRVKRPAVAFCRDDGQTFIVVPSDMDPPYTQMPTRTFRGSFSVVFF